MHILSKTLIFLRIVTTIVDNLWIIKYRLIYTPLKYFQLNLVIDDLIELLNGEWFVLVIIFSEIYMHS